MLEICDQGSSSTVSLTKTAAQQTRLPASHPPTNVCMFVHTHSHYIERTKEKSSAFYPPNGVYHPKMTGKLDYVGAATTTVSSVGITNRDKDKQRRTQTIVMITESSIFEPFHPSLSAVA